MTITSLVAIIHESMVVPQPPKKLFLSTFNNIFILKVNLRFEFVSETLYKKLLRGNL